MGVNYLKAVLLQSQHELAVVRIERTPYHRTGWQVFDNRLYRSLLSGVVRICIIVDEALR